MGNIGEKNLEFVTLNESDLIYSIEKGLGKKFIRVSASQFADSETYIKSFEYDSLKNKNIFIFQQFSFEQKSLNDQLMEFFFLVDLIRNIGVKSLRVILPYFPYSRQDKNFDKNYSGPIFLIDRFLKSAFIDEVVCFELHKSALKEKFLTKVTEISLIDFGINFFKTNIDLLFDKKDLCFVSPDEGRARSIKNIAQKSGVDFAYVDKERTGKDLVLAEKLIGEVKNKNVVIIDDIIDTGNTAISACDIVIKNGAKRVVGCFGHPVLSKDAVEKMDKSNFEKIFITDTVLTGNKLKKSNKIINVSLAQDLIKLLKENYL